MKLIPPPPPSAPIGRLPDGTPVLINQDWALYLTVGLLNRLGGVNGESVQTIISRGMPMVGDDFYQDDIPVIPGPTGPAGPAGQSGTVMLWETEHEAEALPVHPGTPVVSGVYTPTLTNVLNLDSSAAFECQFMRYGSVVVVSGKVELDATAASTITSLGISLPIPSNITAATQCSGTAMCQNFAGMGAAIIGDTVNKRADLRFQSSDTAARSMHFIFMYQVL